MLSGIIRVALPFGGRMPEHKRRPYRDALAAARIQPVEDATSLVGLDGLLLAGGGDVDPALYGAVRQPETDQPEPDRDRLEAALLREALDRDVPVLAICRGLQLVNVVLGGTLLQHIEGHRCPGQQEVHGVAIQPGGRLREILRVDELAVNSRHHQCVDRVADGLVVSARAADQVIEAVELPGKRFVVAVQWHPEDRTDGLDARLFEAFGNATRNGAAAA